MARIAVAGFQHETNTFSPVKATWEDFEKGEGWPALQRGGSFHSAFAGMNLPIEGFMKEAMRLRHALVPLAWAATTPCSYVTEDAFERMAALVTEDLKKALPVDAVYLDLHGAMVTEHLEDGEGEFLRRVRAAVGDKVPVVASLDLHCNTTEKMVREASVLIAYRTYPHVDMADTGARVARHLDMLLKGRRIQAKAFRKLPFIMPLTVQCTMVEPSGGVYRFLESLEGGPVSSVSFTPGFPQADIADCGPAVMAYGDDQASADRAADALAKHIVEREAAFVDELLAPAEALKRAYAMPAGKPVVLADAQDNTGAGGTGDTTGLLRAMLDAGAENALLGLICDPETAARAHQVGTGRTGTFDIGGKLYKGDPTLSAEFAVEGLSDGQFLCTGPFYGGTHAKLGPTAVLRRNGVRAVVTSKRMQAADQEMFRHVGAEPKTARVLGVKSSVHFRADFQPIAEAVLVVASPGAAPMDPRTLPYKRLRKGVRLSPLGPTR
ncbi:MAG: M81 family metallopeptidase [Alphaproteobacteria bacterium]|nr:M81 family metallopeptidase [Alphaproteobacteria bacterium]